MEARPLIVIVGPTASGKTSLSIDLAKRFKGEIICADSRTIFKGMDIGTAKPTRQERADVPHWGLDLVEPGESFSAYDFKKYAEAKIEDIRLRGKIPFIVGGTGLYVDAVLFDYQFGSPADYTLRQEMQMMSVSELQKYCSENNVSLPENAKNKRHLIHAIEQNNVQAKRRDVPRKDAIVVGIATERAVLRQRIRDRSEQLFKDGVVNEATLLGKKYGWGSEAMTGNIYPLVQRYNRGEISFQEMKEKFMTLDWRLAKRQLTWLRRNSFIKWLPLDDARKYLTGVLANKM